MSPSPLEHPSARAALLPAVEIVTALDTFKDSDPEQFWAQLETVLAGSSATGPGADDGWALAELLFGLVHLAGLLLDQAAGGSCGDRAAVLQQIAARAVDPAR